MERVATKATKGLVYVVWELTLALRSRVPTTAARARAGARRTSSRPTRRSTSCARWRSSASRRSRSSAARRTCATTGPTIAAAIVASGMRCTMTTGGRGMTPERARAAKAAGLPSVSVSVDGLRESHDALRGVDGSFDAAMAALANLRDAGVTSSANTQINRLSVPRSRRAPRSLRRAGVTGWQMQLTVPMGRAADEPEWLLQPYQLLEVFPRVAELARRGAERGVLFWPATTSATSVRTRRSSAGAACARTSHGAGAAPAARARASSRTATSRAARRCRRASTWAATCASDRSARSGTTHRSASRATAPSRSSGASARIATTPTPAARAAPGRRTSSSDAAATTRTATTARSSSKGAASASASCASKRRRAAVRSRTLRNRGRAARRARRRTEAAPPRRHFGVTVSETVVAPVSGCTSIWPGTLVAS